MLKKPYKITKNKDFKTIFKQSGFFKNQFFLLRYKKNNLLNSRFGFVVSKKVSKRAVDRNKIKRRAREVIRLHINEIKPGYDIIFFMGNNSLDASYSELELNIKNSLKEINLL